MSPVSRTTTHMGPNGRVQAIQSCGAPTTYRMFACRPRTRMSRSCARIWASARSRRSIRRARSSGETSVVIGGVGVVGDRQVAVFGNAHDLLTAVAARPVLPHHRFQYQDHAGWKDEVVVE